MAKSRFVQIAQHVIHLDAIAFIAPAERGGGGVVYFTGLTPSASLRTTIPLNDDQLAELMDELGVKP